MAFAKLGSTHTEKIAMGRRERPPENPTGLYHARKLRDMSKTELARATNVNKQTIDKLEGGIMKLTRQWAERFAKPLQLTAREIIFWDETQNTTSAMSGNIHTDSRGAGVVSGGFVPLLGVAEAGAFRQMLLDNTTDHKEVAAPRSRLYPNAKHFALQIRGDSMNAAKPSPMLDGMIAVCVDIADAEIEIESGKIYAVQYTRDGGKTHEISLRRARVFANRTELYCESTNTAYEPLTLHLQANGHAGEINIIGLVYFFGYDLEA